MDSITALTTLKTRLQAILTDPRVTAGAVDARTWIYTDEPLLGTRYPYIQLEKLNNPTSNISIGSNYWEHELLLVNVWFYTKNGFKNTIGGTDYVNAQLVEYNLGQIKEKLKDDFDNLFTAGLGGYRHLNTTKVGYDPKTQLYFGGVTIRVWYFNQ